MDDTVGDGNVRTDNLCGRLATGNIGAGRVAREREGLSASAGKALRGEAGGVDSGAIDDVICQYCADHRGILGLRSERRQCRIEGLVAAKGNRS